MKKVILICAVASVVSFSFGKDTLSLDDSTVVADRQDSGTGIGLEGAWFGEAVTDLTIGFDDLAENECIEISGRITAITDMDKCWIEIGLIPAERWDYWQDAWGGDWKSAVFDKGLYVVSWFSHAQVLGLSLQEGWNVGGTTITTDDGPFVWPLNRPNETNPWEFSISMYPDVDGGQAYLGFDSGRIYGDQPFDFGWQEENNNDYSQCYLIAQVWSEVEDARFSFERVRARVIKTKDGSK